VNEAHQYCGSEQQPDQIPAGIGKYLLQNH
jgi:hypothetical protein